LANEVILFTKDSLELCVVLMRILFSFCSFYMLRFMGLFNLQGLWGFSIFREEIGTQSYEPVEDDVKANE